MMTRRQAIATSLFSSAALSMLATADAAESKKEAAKPATGPFTLPPLGYAYDALEPIIDEETMHLHHDKHHAGYVAKLNEAMTSEEGKKYADKSVEDLLLTLSALPDSIQKAVRNNGGGHYNHSLFWQMLKKDGGKPSSALLEDLTKTFGSMDEFWKKFSEAGGKQFGSGWAWLVVGPDKKLAVVSTANQDSPVTDHQSPILGLDVWEHAYYLKYRNKRADYITAFPKIVNWGFVNSLYEKAIS